MVDDFLSKIEFAAVHTTLRDKGFSPHDLAGLNPFYDNSFQQNLIIRRYSARSLTRDSQIDRHVATDNLSFEQGRLRFLRATF